MKIVADTNFLISATQWDYSVSHKLLKKLIMDNAEIFTTKEILDEFEDVLKRDFLYNEEDARNIVEKTLKFLTLVIPGKKVDVVKEDPDDNIILECAIESNAEYILSYDKHLLNLKEYEKIKIIKPEEALSWESKK